MNFCQRLLVATLTVVGLLAPLGAALGQPAKVARVGYLSTQPAAVDAANREAFRQGMRALGYVEGQNLLVEARYADGNQERLAGLAAEIVRLDVDVIVAATTLAVRAAQQATATVPVVMAFAGDAVADGLVSSLARPGGMTTGLSAAVGEIAAKRIELLQAVLPKSARVVLLAAPAASHSMVSATETAGRAMGLQVSTQRIRDAGDVARALTPGPSERIDGVIVDLVIRQNTALILELSRDRRWPTVSGPREFAEQGGLMAYGPNYPDMFRRAASYVDKILRGAKPADLPVEQPTKFELLINLRTARALGVTIPPALLTRADELIQ
jgi:putative tryptophan/tyrosine transport system substrate-binding protein